MKTLLTLSSGIMMGLFSALLLIRAGFPPALAGVFLWIIGGAIALSLLQFAFLQKTIRDSAEAAKEQPLRAFLVGVLILLVPVLAASCMSLGGAQELGAFAIFVFFGLVFMIFWPAAVSYVIGQRLAPQHTGPGRITAGSVVATSSLMLPVLGWLWLFYLTALTTGGLALRKQHA